MQIKSPAYVGLTYALSQTSTGVRGLLVYIKNVILKGEMDELAATKPELARQLGVLKKVYDAYIADLVIRANQLQHDFALEEGKARKGKWAKACQAMPTCLFRTLLERWDEVGPFDDQHACEDEVALRAANLDANLRISGLDLTSNK